MTTQTLEQRVAHLEAELERISGLLQAHATQHPSVNQHQPLEAPENSIANDLPLGVFENDPYFDEIIQRMREERELDADNPAYT